MPQDPQANSQQHPFPTADKIAECAESDAGRAGSRTEHRKPTEEKVDKGVEESFPASDPVAVTITRVATPSDAESAPPRLTKTE